MNETKHIINLSFEEKKNKPKGKKTILLLGFIGVMALAYVNKDYVKSLLDFVPVSFETAKNDGFTLDLKENENKNSMDIVSDEKNEKNLPKEEPEIKKDLINKMTEEIQKKNNSEENENQFAVNFDNQVKAVDKIEEVPKDNPSMSTPSNLQKNIDALRNLEQQKEIKENSISQLNEENSENTLSDANGKRELSLLLKNSKIQIDAKKESVNLFINNIPHKIGDNILSNNNFYIKNISIDCKPNKLPSFNVDIYKRTDNVKLQTISKNFSDNKKVVLFFDALSITDEESGNENVYLQDDEIFKGFKLSRIGYTKEKKVKQVFECNKTQTIIVGDELEIIK